jgi:hypothetical protein
MFDRATFCQWIASKYVFEGIVNMDFELGKLVEKLQNVIALPLPLGPDAKKFLVATIESFRVEFYAPALTYYDEGNDDERNNANFEEKCKQLFLTAKQSLHQNVKVFATDVVHHQRGDHKANMEAFYFSGEINVVLKSLRTWLNLLMRTHYLVTYDQSFTMLSILQDTEGIWCYPVFKYIGKWIEFVCQEFLPVKITHNSRVMMDYNPDACFLACCKLDFDRIKNSDWTLFPRAESFVESTRKTFTLIGNDTQGQKTTDYYRDLIRMLLRIQLNYENEWKIVTLLEDLYDAGETRVTKYLVEELVYQYDSLRIGFDSIWTNTQVHRYNRLVHDLASLFREDSLRAFKKAIHLPTLWNLETRVTGKYSKEKLQSLYDSLMLLVGKQDYERGLGTLIAERFVCTKNNLGLFERSTVGGLKVVEAAWIEHLLDLCRYATLVRGISSHNAFVGFIRFFMLVFKQLGHFNGDGLDGSLLNTPVSHGTGESMVLGQDGFLYQERLLKFNGNICKNLYYHCVDSIRFIQSLHTPVAGVDSCNRYIAAYNKLSPNGLQLEPIKSIDTKFLCEF